MSWMLLVGDDFACVRYGISVATSIRIGRIVVTSKEVGGRAGILWRSLYLSQDSKVGIEDFSDGDPYV